MLEHALALAARGMFVFPVTPGSKRPPCFEGWQHAATRDAAQVTALWELYPEANPGISTSKYLEGRALVVIDLDPKGSPVELILLELEDTGRVFPPTLEQSTPRGGRHLFYWTAQPLRQGTKMFGRTDVDVRSRGGYVVGAGGVRPEGAYKIYRDLPIAQAPAWLVAELAERSAAPAVQPAAARIEVNIEAATARAIEYLRDPRRAPAAVEGEGGDETTLKVALVVRDYVPDPGLCLDLLLEHYNERCEPPWSYDEMAAKVRNAFAYGRGKPGGNAPEIVFAAAPLPALPPLAADAAPAETTRPLIVLGQLQLQEEIEQAWDAVLRRNGEHLELFNRCDSLVRLRGGPAGPSIQPASLNWTHGLLTRSASWCRPTKGGGLVASRPDYEITKDMIERPAPGLPTLEAVGGVPMFAASGRLVRTAGYHADVAYYFHGADLPAPSERPTDAEIAAARQLLTEDLLGNFPFTEDADLAHVLTAMLSPIVRHWVNGCTPLHVFGAPAPGSGKSLLASVVAWVTTGVDAAMCVLPQSEDEIRKRITAQLLAARPVVVLDNNQEGKTLNSDALASLLTSMEWTDRRLGESSMVTVPNRSLWILTGNNPQLRIDIARRCASVRIDAKVARPWERSGFRHANLAEWVRSERPRLVGALLTLAQAWHARGRPLATKPYTQLGSFEPWCRVHAGILEVAGVPGFLENARRHQAASDQESGDWEQLVEAWWVAFGGQPVTARQIERLANQEGLLKERRGHGNELSRESRMGRALVGCRGKVYGEFEVQDAARPARGAHATHHRLVPRGLRGLRLVERSNAPASENPSTRNLQQPAGGFGDFGTISDNPHVRDALS